MARNIRVTDVNLYQAMKTTMMRSLRQSTLMKMFALERDVPVRFHGHGTNEPVNYCMVCEEEVNKPTVFIRVVDPDPDSVTL
jgi:hypothetical protein